MGAGLHSALLFPFVIGHVQIEQHKHAGLGIDAEQRNQADPDRNAHVVIERIQQPDGAHGREGHSQKHNHGFDEGARVEIEQQKDDEDRHGQHDRKFLGRALHVFELAAPDQAVSGRQNDLLLHKALGVRDIAADIRARNVYIDIAAQPAVFIPNHPRPRLQFDFRDLCNGNLLAVHGRNQRAIEPVDGVAIIALITNIDGISFAAFHRRCDGVAADCAHHDHIGLVDRQAVAGERIAFQIEIEEIAARRAFGEGAGRPRHIPDRGFDLPADLLNFRKVRAEHLDADGRAHAGGQHIDARLDGHGPCIDDAGNLQGLVQSARTVNQFLRASVIGPDLCETRPQPFRRARGIPARLSRPLFLRLQNDNRFHHRERRGVGGRFGAARFAEHAIDLGEGAQNLVLHLQQPLRFRDGDAGHGCRHIKQYAFIERRHEFRAEFLIRRNREQDHERGGKNREDLMTQHEFDHGLIDSHQGAAQGMAFFAMDSADEDRVRCAAQPARAKCELFDANETQHQRGDERDRENGRRRHRKIFSQGQRLEQAAFLRLEGEDRNKRDRDDQQ